MKKEFRIFFKDWLLSSFPDFYKVDQKKFSLPRSCDGYISNKKTNNNKYISILLIFSESEDSLFTIEIGLSDDEDIPDFCLAPFETGRVGRFRISDYWGRTDYWWSIKTSEKLRLLNRKNFNSMWVMPREASYEEIQSELMIIINNELIKIFAKVGYQD